MYQFYRYAAVQAFPQTAPYHHSNTVYVTVTVLTSLKADGRASTQPAASRSCLSLELTCLVQKPRRRTEDLDEPCPIATYEHTWRIAAVCLFPVQDLRCADSKHQGFAPSAVNRASQTAARE
jgi:hypothetical protein